MSDRIHFRISDVEAKKLQNICWALARGDEVVLSLDRGAAPLAGPYNPPRGKALVVTDQSGTHSCVVDGPTIATITFPGDEPSPVKFREFT